MLGEPTPQSIGARLLPALTGQSSNWLLTIVLSAVFGKLTLLLLGVVAFALVGPETIEDFSGKARAEVDATLLLLALGFAPLFESLIVWLSVWFLGFKWRLDWRVSVFVAGFIHVPLHGWTLYSVAVLPTFALQALILGHWIAKGRAEAGYWIIVLSHALQNSFGLLAYAIS